MALRAVFSLVFLVGIVPIQGCSSQSSRSSADGMAKPAENAAVAHRGPFERRVLITGELVAADALALVVPQTSNWQIEVRWLAPDGSLVQAGERVAELDNSAILDQLEEKEIALDQSAIELEGQVAQQRVDVAEKRFAVEQQKTAVAKAELDADLPADLISRRELQEKQLALVKARLALEKAEEDLRSTLVTSTADLDVRRVEMEKSRREIDAAHRSIAALDLRSPVTGVWVVGIHPWEGRKIQIGDSVFVGLTLGTVPNLSSVIVEGRLADVDDGAIAPGMPAQVLLDAYPGRVFPGRVREVSGIAQELASETTRRFFKVLVDLNEVDTEHMIPGMSARVEVLAEQRADALLVPRTALRNTAEGVFFGQGAAARAVQLGPCSEFECVVQGGLEGDGLEGVTGGAP